MRGAEIGCNSAVAKLLRVTQTEDPGGLRLQFGLVCVQAIRRRAVDF